MNRRVGWSVVYAAALAGAFAPIPAWTVERWYSQGLYPVLQRLLTGATNLVPFALFDVMCVAAAAAAATVTYRCIRTMGWRAAARVTREGSKSSFSMSGTRR